MADSPTGYQVENRTFPVVRKRLNEILQALTTLNYRPSGQNPSVMLPYMIQVVDIAGKLRARVRNATNDGWLYNVLGGTEIPPGTGMDYFGAGLPDGWLWRDGKKYQQAAYPELFAAIGTIYNTGGEAAGEFRVPDDRDRVAVGGPGGLGSNFTIGVRGGEFTTLITRNHLPNYPLPVVDPGHAHNLTTDPNQITNNGSNFNATGAEYASGGPGDSLEVVGNFTGITATLGGGGQNLSLMQPFIVCNKMIKT